MLPIEREDFFPLTAYSVINRLLAEEKLKALIGGSGTEATATALKAVQLIRALPVLALSRADMARLIKEAEIWGEVPPATEGVVDKLCAKKMPQCICVGCKRNHSDGTRICCVEHGHSCMELCCPDYERKRK